MNSINFEQVISRYEEQKKELRDRELSYRLLSRRSAEEMLAALHALKGLNVEERAKVLVG